MTLILKSIIYGFLFGREVNRASIEEGQRWRYDDTPKDSPLKAESKLIAEVLEYSPGWVKIRYDYYGKGRSDVVTEAYFRSHHRLIP